MKKVLALAILMVAFSAFASADTLPVNGGWTTFGWSTNDAGAVVFSGPYTFSGAAAVSVVDCCAVGDRFSVYDNGSLLGTTDPTFGSPSPCFDGDACWNSGMSQGLFLVGDGSHSISFELYAAAPGFEGQPGNGFLRADSTVPEPGTMVLLGTGLVGFGMRRFRKS